MVNNFEQIKELLKFDNDDTFYFIQILKRKKEHPELGNTSYVVKTYYIKSVDDLEFFKPEMICLAEFHNARVCINLNRRSFKQMAFQTLRKITDIIMNEDYKSVKAAYNSVCGVHSSETDKMWILDIDDFESTEDLLFTLRHIEPVGSKFIAEIPTKNGVHIITKPFNVETFRTFPEYRKIDLHKNNPTILYIP